MAEKLIYEKIVNILKSTEAIGKSRKNASQGFMFRGIDEVMNEMHKIFSDNEVFILQEVIDFETQDRPTKSGGINTYTRAKIKFSYTTTDGSSVSTINVGEAMDSGDKGMNKAMSIALKYSILQMFLIPTEEQKDPDAITPEETSALDLAKLELSKAKTKEEVASVYYKYTTLKDNVEFKGACAKRRDEIE